MDDAFRVSLGDGDARLEDVLDPPSDREGPLLLNEGLEIEPFEQFHHEKGGAGFGQRAGVGDPGDVLRPELPRRARFPQEPLDDLSIACHLGQ